MSRTSMTGAHATGTPICILLDFQQEHYSALVKKRAEFGDLAKYLLNVTAKSNITINPPALTILFNDYVTSFFYKED